MRATFRPCSLSGMAQPRTRSSIAAGSTPARAQRLLDHRRAQVVRAGVAEAALGGAAERGPHGRENGNVAHGQFLRGLLVVSMYWMRSRVFGSPHSDRKPRARGRGSPARSRVAPAGTLPPPSTRASAMPILASCSLIWCAPTRFFMVSMIVAEPDLADDPDAPRRRRPVAGARQAQHHLLGVAEQRLARHRRGRGGRQVAHVARLLGAGRHARARQHLERHAHQRQQIEVGIVGAPARTRAPPAPCSRRRPGSGRRRPRRSRCRARPRRGRV